MANLRRLWSFLYGIILWSCMLRAFFVSGRLIRKGEARTNSTLQEFERGMDMLEQCKTLNCSFAIDGDECEKFKESVYTEKALAIFITVNVTNSTNNEETAGKVLGESGGNGMENGQVKQMWVWLRDVRGKFLATLPYDFDILSLSTLKKDVLTLKFTTTPQYCFTNMSKTCRRSFIATAIFNNCLGHTYGNLCVRPQEHEEYRCCKKKRQ